MIHKSQKPIHILIVDDDPELAESLADYIKKTQEFQVSYVHDGQSAIDFMQNSVGKEDLEIDLIILEMRMPNLSGLDVLNWIRQHPELSYTRVVLVTAAAGSQEKVEALMAGADDYINKPYRPLELLARVNTILRTQQLEKQLQRQSQQLAALNNIGQKMAVTLEMGEVLETAVSGVDDLIIGVEFSVVLMAEKGKLRYKAVNHLGEMIEVVGLPAVSATENVLGVAFSRQTATFLNQPHADPNFNPEEDAPSDFTVISMIVAPLVVRGRAVGVIAAYNKTDNLFTEVDLDLFASLASSISGAIENVWLFQRIRQRQQGLLENRNTLQALIDGISNPIYTINDDWQLISINKTKAEELEVTPENLTNQACFQAFFHREIPCEHCLVANVLNEKAPYSWVFELSNENAQSPVIWSINAYPIPSQQTSAARAVIVWQDRTETIKIQSLLQEQNESLRELDKRKSEFLSTVSHELRTPLMPIKGSIENLLSEMYGSINEKQRNRLEIALASVNHEARLIENLLDIVRIEEGRVSLSLREVVLNEIIISVCQILEYDSEKKGISLISDIPSEEIMLELDRDKIKQVLLNLIHNAIKFTLKGGTITITILNNNDSVQINIEDTGIGIPIDKLETIFDRFYQVDSSLTRKIGGTGIGLSIVKEYVELHGGVIWVNSIVNQGSIFSFTLPKQR